MRARLANVVFFSRRRYMLITLGGLTLLFAVVRIAVFGIPESPRYLIAVGDDAGAVASVEYVARKNGKVSPLTVADFEAVDRRMGMTSALEAEKRKRSVVGVVVASVKDYRGKHIRALFSTRKMAIHCTVLWTIWAAVGISFVRDPTLILRSDYGVLINRHVF